MYSFKLNSHPDKLLVNHTDEVYNKGIKLFEEKDIFLEEKEFLKTILISHDLGKGTKYFQDYIISRENHGELKNHGFLSALICYSILNKKMDMDRALKGFILVKRHHGNMENIFDELSIKQIDINYRLNILEKQLETLDIEEVNVILDKYFEPKITKDDILNSFQYLFSEMEGIFFYEDEMKKNIDEYFKMKYFYSLLIYSDKFSVILSQNSYQKNLLDSKPFFSYMNSLQDNKNEINISRKKAQQEVADSLDLNEKLLTITLPTGMGKTLNSLNFALRLREKLFKKTSVYYNIIYSFPFTSIIDQTYETFESIFGNNTSNLMKHHYLARVEYKDGENDFNIDESKFLIETWDSNIVVTTFVKVLETLFSNRNRELMKFHKMAKSIVILDEVQNIPYKYWKIIKVGLTTLSKEFNTYFLLMTATQPYILGESYELVKDINEYFSLFNRTKIVSDLEEKSVGEFVEKIIPIVNANDKSMIVLNTVKSAQEVYRGLKEKTNKKTIFLSASIVPKDRKNRLKSIKKLDEYILVSTQVVEAGVDIDNGVVIRDLGPWDSIVQCAGRCNRNGKDERKPVYIFKLKSERFVFANLIYGRFLIDKTEQIIKSKREIEEVDYLNYSKEYFSLIERDKSDDDSNQILDDINNLNFEYIDKQFKIIEKRNINIIPVFIEKDREAKKLWCIYEDIGEIRDKFERSKEFLKIKDKFLSYVINVDMKKFPFELDKFYGKIPYENIDYYYDEELGYKTDDDQTLFF